MRGARGLLISITGGKDLTLYEVDEAATRIREEVDADANIIVGATFDESLDGIIRVSVVATGIDIATGAAARPAGAIPAPPQARPAAPPAPALQRVAAEAKSAEEHERRIAELALRLKADNARTVEAAEAHGARRRSRRPSPSLRRRRQQRADLMAAAAVAAALTPSPAAPEADPVRRPDAARGPAGAGRERPAQGLHPAAARAAGEPRAADDADLRGPAGPRPERVPGAARRDAGAGASGEAAPHPAATPGRGRSRPARRRAGAGAEGGASAGAGATRPSVPPMRPRPDSSPRPPESRSSEFAKRGAPQGSTLMAVPAPVPHASEDDQLDIPAFLRRQAT